MEAFKTNLKDCFLLKPKSFIDDRGFFIETYNKRTIENLLNINIDFFQSNHSRSSKNVLRGLHFQLKNPQGKLVRVSKGRVLDVALDIRKNSPTFGHHYSTILSDENHHQLWIPPGFAHGFLVLSAHADFQYNCTEYYREDDQYSILWNDSFLNIDWKIENPILSEKDANAKTLDYFISCDMLF